mmetsp:Transcript_3035/g.8782  ORF Transcript_3035/g.8782 Transcript_3035/m.8782 type:complete len:260 (+) Transcript_3035:319-1098(+)
MHMQNRHLWTAGLKLTPSLCVDCRGRSAQMRQEPVHSVAYIFTESHCFCHGGKITVHDMIAPIQLHAARDLSNRPKVPLASRRTVGAPSLEVRDEGTNRCDDWAECRHGDPSCQTVWTGPQLQNFDTSAPRAASTGYNPRALEELDGAGAQLVLAQLLHARLQVMKESGRHQHAARIFRACLPPPRPASEHVVASAIDRPFYSVEIFHFVVLGHNAARRALPNSQLLWTILVSLSGESPRHTTKSRAWHASGLLQAKHP